MFVKMYYNIIYVFFGAFNVEMQNEERRFRMFIMGITGPSGAGKGALADILSSLGMQIIDADHVYHEVITPPSDCLAELAQAFGDKILRADGTLDRKALASIVFGEKNRDKLLLLNKISHKYVAEKIKSEICDFKERGERLCVIDAPLLIEAGLCDICDLTVAVLANKKIRLERISKRDGITYDAAEARISSQKDDEFYISNTDFVIYNDSDVEKMRTEIVKILHERKCGCL